MPKSIDQEGEELAKIRKILRRQQEEWLKRQLAALPYYPNLSSRNGRRADALGEAADQIEHLIASLPKPL